MASSVTLSHVFRDGKCLTRTTDGKEFEWGSIGLMHARALAPPPPPQEVPEHREIVPLNRRIDEQRDMLIQNISLFLTIQYLWEKSYGQPFHYPVYTEMLEKARTAAEDELKTLPLSYRSDRSKRADCIEQALKKIFFKEVAKLHAAEIIRLEEQQLDDPTRPLASLGSSLLTKAIILSFKAKSSFVELKAKAIYYLFIS